MSVTPIAAIWLDEVQKDEGLNPFSQRAALAVAREADVEGHVAAANAAQWARRITDASGHVTSYRTAKNGLTRLRRDGYLQALAYSAGGTEQRLRLPAAA